MTFSPRSITFTEANPTSVTSYELLARIVDVGTVIAGPSAYPSDSGPTTIIPIGSNGFFSGAEAHVGIGIIITYVQIGPQGDRSDAKNAETSDGVDVIILNSLPDGAEAALLTP
jgi:hypothetical protein